MKAISTNKDPLHGMTLAAILTILVERFGWQRLAEQVNINCFKNDPSIKSSLTFLRRTPWARQQVEELYIRWVGLIAKKIKILQIIGRE